MKELEKKAKKELLEIYELYLSPENKKEIEEKARNIYNEYIAAGTLLSDETMKIVSKMFAIAYPNAGSNIKPPSREETKKIIAKLK